MATQQSGPVTRESDERPHTAEGTDGFNPLPGLAGNEKGLALLDSRATNGTNQPLGPEDRGAAHLFWTVAV